MTDQDVDRVLACEPLRSIDPDKFPPWQPLRDIIRNDTRLRRYRDGEIVVRAGDYGNSAFVVLEGKVHVVIKPELPDGVLGRRAPANKDFFEALSQLWTNHLLPEVRDPSRFGTGYGTIARGEERETHIFLQDVPRVLNRHKTDLIGKGEIFGEIAALGRMPRTRSIFSVGDTELLEIRWQGLRDIRQQDDGFRKQIDDNFRRYSLSSELAANPYFKHLDASQIAQTERYTLFETYGDYDWYASYQELAKLNAAERLEHQPIIAEEGCYPDGLLIIRSGFARVSQKINNGHRTVSFLGRGGVFGLEEIVHNWRTGEQIGLQNSLRGLGYVNVLRVPTAIVEEKVLPALPPDKIPEPIKPSITAAGGWEAAAAETGIDAGLFEFLVENQYINGTATMMIDMDKCVRCDACVGACAAAHDNNPKFVRHGKRYGKFMVANACMHCVDPVCMIGCPTGAIHRSTLEGQVVINDDTCIGCQSCAESCPYDNIRMVEIRDEDGSFILNERTNEPILKASKCDLCVDQMGGPACQRACPHDALHRVDMRNLAAEADWLKGT